MSPLKEKIKNLPDLPGVYLMKNLKGVVIYIGKAISIKKRVKSYFSNAKDSRPTVKFLVPKITDIEFIVTKTEKEALILENTLIKKYKPKYNINLKDDKSYVSLKLTVKHKFPRLFLTRRLKKDGSLYFGPYSSASAVRETLEILRDIFLLRTCSDATLNNRSRACLNYQIKKCTAPCVGYISKTDYQNAVDGVKMFLNGDAKGLIRKLKSDMKAASRKEDFEEAARIRDQISAIDLTVEKQRVVTHKNSLNNDLIGALKEGDDISVTVINVRGGSLTSLKNHIFLGSGLTEDEALSSFIKQFYHGDKEIPKEINISKSIREISLIKEWLTEKRGSAVNIKVPGRGESKRIMEMALENAKQSLLNRLRSKESIHLNLNAIKEKLGLNNFPGLIECYDISNIMGKQAVGSKVVLKEGELEKDGYRRYRIRTKDAPDDYSMMYEMLKRRFKGLDPPPDLIIIDGGKGHLAIALRVLDELEITGIDVVSLAKEKKLKTEAKEERIYIPGRKNPIVITGLGAAFNMLIKLRDEAHRFAIRYHRKLRGKKATTSVLDGIKGIGPKKRELILSSIGSLDNLTEERLNKIKGLSQKDIANILVVVRHMPTI
jgi:excinuclease ABC subunit C